MHISTTLPLTTFLLLSLTAAAPAPANRLQRQHFASGKSIDATALALGRRNVQVPQLAHRPKKQPHQARQDSGSDNGGDGGTSSPSDFAGIGNDGDSGNNDNNNNLFNFGDTFAGQPSYADSGPVKRDVPDVENRLMGRVHQRKRQAQQAQGSNTAQQDPATAAAQADAVNDFGPATPPMDSSEQAIANAIEAPILAADNQNKRKQRKQRKRQVTGPDGENVDPELTGLNVEAAQEAGTATQIGWGDNDGM